MHTVSCVRTLSIGPRGHGPRLCMHRAHAAKVALRRSRSRETWCCSRHRRSGAMYTSRLIGGLSGVQQRLRQASAENKGCPESAPLGGVGGDQWRAHSGLLSLPRCQKIGLWGTLNQVAHARAQRSLCDVWAPPLLRVAIRRRIMVSYNTGHVSYAMKR